MIKCICCHGSLNKTDTGYSCSLCNKQFPLIEGIIQFSKELPDAEYYFPDGGFDLLYTSEEKSFWFGIRNIIIGRLLQKYLPINSRLLEVGCGTGYVSGYLKKTGYNIECADLFLEGLHYCQMRDSGNAYYRYNLYDEIFSEEFDGVLACDVIEHLEDDETVLKNFNRSLKTGGIMLLTVPACNSLWSAMDNYAGHKRRYSPEELQKKCVTAGFNVIKISYFMMLLFPVIALSRWCTRFQNSGRLKRDEKMKGKAKAELQLSPILNSIFYRIFSLEIPLITHMNLPIGSSLVCIAKKERSL